MFAGQATSGNEYIIPILTRNDIANVHIFERTKTKATCAGWNYNHTKLIFFYVAADGSQQTVGLAENESIQAVD